MVICTDFKWKSAADKIMILLFLFYNIINIFPRLIVNVLGGVGNIFVIYMFSVYFIFIYGKPCKNRNGKIQYIPLLIFLAVYTVFMQFLYEKAQYYVALGVPFETHVWNLVSFTPLLISAICIVKKTEPVTMLRFKKYFVLFVAATVVPSIIMLINDSTLAKESATGYGSFHPFLVGYSMISALAVIVPYFLVNVFASKHKFVYIAMVALIAACVLFSSFLIATVAMLLSIAVYFALKIRNKAMRHITVIVILLLLIAVVYTGTINDVLNKIADIVPSDLIATRLRQLVLFSETGKTGDTTARIDLYRRAINLVRSHPVLGNILFNSEQLSGHSELLDVWGGCGIFPLALLLYSFASVYKYNRVFCKTPNSRAALTASTIALTFISLTNTVFSSPPICMFWVMAPIMLCPSENGVLKS